MQAYIQVNWGILTSKLTQEEFNKIKEVNRKYFQQKGENLLKDYTEDSYGYFHKGWCCLELVRCKSGLKEVVVDDLQKLKKPTRKIRKILEELDLLELEDKVELCIYTMEY